ncbi:MAG: hypothetical protein ACUVRJ_07080 [Candidatus Villigracilaceae bacterium]
MNTTSNPQENFEVFPSPIFDPFPEPQTMPKGWDLSEFAPAFSQSAAQTGQVAAEA